MANCAPAEQQQKHTVNKAIKTNEKKIKSTTSWSGPIWLAIVLFSGGASVVTCAQWLVATLHYCLLLHAHANQRILCSSKWAEANKKKKPTNFRVHQFLFRRFCSNEIPTLQTFVFFLIMWGFQFSGISFIAFITTQSERLHRQIPKNFLAFFAYKYLINFNVSMFRLQFFVHTFFEFVSRFLPRSSPPVIRDIIKWSNRSINIKIRINNGNEYNIEILIYWNNAGDWDMIIWARAGAVMTWHVIPLGLARWRSVSLDYSISFLFLFRHCCVLSLLAVHLIFIAIAAIVVSRPVFDRLSACLCLLCLLCVLLEVAMTFSRRLMVWPAFWRDRWPNDRKYYCGLQWSCLIKPSQLNWRRLFSTHRSIFAHCNCEF